MVHRQEPVSARAPGSPPVRTCVGCRVRAMAGELLRVAVVDGDLVLDLRRRIAGRGAWIHPDPDCLGRAERRRAFTRALRVPGPLDVTVVRGQLERLTGSVTDSELSRVSQEDSVETGPETPGPTPTRKQVDPS